VDEDGIGAVAATAVAALALLAGLFLPLFTVRYAPPGGSGLVDGHPMAAFTETITGWQFIDSAHWTELLYVLGLLILPAVTLIAWLFGLDAAQYVTKPVLALCGTLAAAGCLLVLGLGLMANPLVMPEGGEKQILPALHTDPFTSGYQQMVQALGLNSPPTPHFVASFGSGWFVLAAALLIVLVALWRWVGYVAVILAAVLVVLRFTDPVLLTEASGYLFPASGG
jgi:ABC-type sugar transport system permease subunit